MRLETLRRHPLFSVDDYEALAAKGYTNAEIAEIWDRDRARGQLTPNPRHDLRAFDVVGYLAGTAKP